MQALSRFATLTLADKSLQLIHLGKKKGGGGLAN